MLWNILLGALGLHNDEHDNEKAAKTEDPGVLGTDEAHVNANPETTSHCQGTQVSGNEEKQPQQDLPIVDTTPGDNNGKTRVGSSKDNKKVKHQSLGVGSAASSSEDVASAVATDITAFVTEPSSTPASPTSSNTTKKNIVVLDATTAMVNAVGQDRASADEDRDTPEDLPTVIHTSSVAEKIAHKHLRQKNRKGTLNGRSKSVISKASSARSSRTRSSVRNEKTLGSQHSTALAASMGQKQEAIAETFAHLIEELAQTPQNADDDVVQSRLDETMEQQRVLITQLQEVITRLEDDARREESENAKLTRRLRSARKRLSGEATTATGKSHGVTEVSIIAKKPPVVMATKKKHGSVVDNSRQKQQRCVAKKEMFPVSEIIVSASSPVDWDELTCLFNEPKQYKSRGTFEL